MWYVAIIYGFICLSISQESIYTLLCSITSWETCQQLIQAGCSTLCASESLPGMLCLDHHLPNTTSGTEWIISCSETIHTRDRCTAACLNTQTTLCRFCKVYYVLLTLLIAFNAEYPLFAGAHASGTSISWSGWVAQQTGAIAVPRGPGQRRGASRIVLGVK